MKHSVQFTIVGIALVHPLLNDLFPPDRIKEDIAFEKMYGVPVEGQTIVFSGPSYSLHCVVRGVVWSLSDNDIFVPILALGDFSKKVLV